MPHLFDLLEIFREVRLDVGAVFCRQLGGAAHELFAAGHGKARADRILEQPFAAPCQVLQSRSLSWSEMETIFVGWSFP